jgi:hypothetical protein
VIKTMIPLAVLAMLAFMFVKVALMLRRDRIRTERERTRGKHAFTPKHRARFLLDRAFRPKFDEQTTQQLLAVLDQVPGKQAGSDR